MTVPLQCFNFAHCEKNTLLELKSSLRFFFCTARFAWFDQFRPSCHLSNVRRLPFTLLQSDYVIRKSLTSLSIQLSGKYGYPYDSGNFISIARVNWLWARVVWRAVRSLWFKGGTSDVLRSFTYAFIVALCNISRTAFFECYRPETQACCRGGETKGVLNLCLPISWCFSLLAPARVSPYQHVSLRIFKRNAFFPSEILNLNLCGSLGCNRFFVTKGFACGNVRIVSCF